jgi:hypothetical protein
MCVPLGYTKSEQISSTSWWKPDSTPHHSEVVKQGIHYYYYHYYNYYYLLTYSMEQSPSWEANRFAASQEIPRIFMEPEGSLLYSQVPSTCPYPEPTPTSPHSPHFNYLNIHLNIIFSSTSGSPQWPFSLWIPHQNPVHTSLLPHTCHMPHSSHSSRFYEQKLLLVYVVKNINNIIIITTNYLLSYI